MSRLVADAIYYEDGVSIILKGAFDGIETFKQVHNLMPPIGSIEHVQLDFSQVYRVDPNELLVLFSELTADRCFDNIDLSIEGLRCGRPDTDLPTIACGSRN